MNSWPLWALPFWTMLVPMFWALYEKFHSPEPEDALTNFGIRTKTGDGHLLSLHQAVEGNVAGAYGMTSFSFSLR